MLNGSWPQRLIDTAARKSLVLFVGSGVSASCRNSQNQAPPTWEKLLTHLADAIHLTEVDSGQRATFDRLIKSRQLLDAAELLKYSANQHSLTSDLIRALKEAVQGPSSDPFLPSDWHKSIGDINPSVIITTNYDKILDSTHGFTYAISSYANEDVDSQIRSNEPIIVKLHGSIDEPSKIILTRSDYARLHRDGSTALDVVRALMWTRTFLFVGYSLSDPDLQALLQDVFAARWSQNVSPHYILISKETSDHAQEMFRHCYGVSPITYDDRSGDYGLKAFQEFGERVSEIPPYATST